MKRESWRIAPFYSTSDISSLSYSDRFDWLKSRAFWFYFGFWSFVWSLADEKGRIPLLLMADSRRYALNPQIGRPSLSRLFLILYFVWKQFGFSFSSSRKHASQTRDWACDWLVMVAMMLWLVAFEFMFLPILTARLRLSSLDAHYSDCSQIDSCNGFKILH